MNLHLDADRFAAVERGWLIVKGAQPERLPDDYDVLGLPPAALSALVGARCETCEGTGNAPSTDWPPTPCSDCLGSGAALLDVTKMMRRFNGGRGGTFATDSLRVCLTGDAVPIVDGSKPEGYDPSGRNYSRMITVDSDGLCRIGDDWDGWTVIDLGPDPQRWIGWFAYPVEVVR